MSDQDNILSSENIQRLLVHNFGADDNDDNDDTLPEDQYQQLYYFTVGVAYYERSGIMPSSVKYIASEKETLTKKEALEIIQDDDSGGNMSYDIVTSLAPISKAQYDCLLQEEEEDRAEYVRRRSEEMKNETFMTHMPADAHGIMIAGGLALFMFVFYNVVQFIAYVCHHLTQK